MISKTKIDPMKLMKSEEAKGIRGRNLWKVPGFAPTFFLLLLLSSPITHAQESGSVFNFLNLPVSAHSTALGGKNISLIEDDISLAIQNPALLTATRLWVSPS